jgi:hypothetical protein
MVVALSLFPTSARASPEGYAGLGVGNGYLGHADDEAGSQTMFIDVELGARVGKRAHVIAKLDDWLLGRYSPDPTLTQSYTATTVGVRWDPLSPSNDELFALSALQLKLAAGFGYMTQRRVGTLFGGDRGAPGGAICAAVAWLPVRGRDWGVGLEVSDQVALSGSGARNMFAVAMTVQLELGIDR